MNPSLSKHEPGHQKQSVTLMLWVAVGIILALLLFNARTIRHGGTTGDFKVFYVAGLRIAEGANIYIKPENAGEYIYPPFLAWVFSFISQTGQAASAWIWGIISSALLTVSLVAASFSIARRFQLPNFRSAAATIALIALALNFDKTRAVFSGGQTDIVTVFGVTMAMVWRRRHPVLAGISLGFSGNVKYVPLTFAALMLVRKQWAAAIWTGIAFVLVAAIPITTLGWDYNLHLWQTALSGLERLFGSSGGELFARSIQDATHPLSISITSAWTRWMTPGPGKAAALAASSGVALCVLAITWRLYARANIPMFPRKNTPRPTHILGPVEWVGWVVAVLAFSPQTQGRHLVLLLPFYIVCVGLLIKPLAQPAVRRAKILLVAALVLFLLATILPPGGDRFRSALMWWRSVGGATWCLLPAWFALVNLATKVINADETVSQDQPATA